MRILQVVPTYYPAVRYGGPIQSVHGLAKSLVERGHDVHVFTTNIDGSGILSVRLEEIVDLDGVKVQYFPTGFGRRIYRSPRMGMALETRIGDFDIAHLHSVFLWPTSAAARAARRARVPYILAPRGMLVAKLIDRKSAVAKNAWIRAIEERNLRNAVAVHVTSEVEASDFRALGLRHRSVITVPNGVDMPNGATNTCRHPLLTHFPRYILFLGRISWKKGLDQLIPVLSRVVEAHLVVAGYDEDFYQAELERLATKAGVVDRVHFIGPVQGEEKWSLLRSARFLALPSYSENFGNAVLEALAVGCPVVVTPQVGLAATIQDAGAGLVVSGNGGELEAAIRSLLENSAMRKQMSTAAQNVVRTRFTWPAVAEKMESIYAQFVA